MPSITEADRTEWDQHGVAPYNFLHQVACVRSTATKTLAVVPKVLEKNLLCRANPYTQGFWGRRNFTLYNARLYATLPRVAMGWSKGSHVLALRGVTTGFHTGMPVRGSHKQTYFFPLPEAFFFLYLCAS